MIRSIGVSPLIAIRQQVLAPLAQLLALLALVPLPPLVLLFSPSLVLDVLQECRDHQSQRFVGPELRPRPPHPLLGFLHVVCNILSWDFIWCIIRGGAALFGRRCAALVGWRVGIIYAACILTLVVLSLVLCVVALDWDASLVYSLCGQAKV